MEKDLISVIVPVYNVEQYLDECVKSLLCQTYKNLEIILIDDGSTDASGEMCDEYAAKDGRIRVVHKENGGLSSARNAGLDICRGKYITFADSDDYVDPEYVGYMYRLLKDNNVLISCCKWRLVYFNGQPEKLSGDTGAYKESQKEYFRNLLYGRRALGQWASLFHSSIFEGIRYRVGILFEDSEIVYKLIGRADYIAVGMKQLYYYRMRSDSITKNGFSPRKLTLISISEELCACVTSRYPDLNRAADSKMIWALFSTLNQLYKSETIDPTIEKEILNKAKKYELSVLTDRDAPARNKFGILIRKLGRKFYIFAWNKYMTVARKRS